MSSCVEDDGGCCSMCLLMLMMVEDGPDADGLQIVSDSREDVWLVVCQSGLSAVRRRGCRANAERHINKSIACLLSPSTYKNTKHLTLNRSISPPRLPSQTYTREATINRKRLTFVKLWIHVDQAEYL